jgi:hypothetical protein
MRPFSYFQLSQLGDSTRSRLTEDDSQTLQQAIVQLCTLREDDMQQSMLMHRLVLIV